MARRRLNRVSGVAIGAALLVLSAATSLAGSVRYEVLDLGTLNGEFRPVALNNGGQVVGSGNREALRAVRTRPNAPVGAGDVLLDGPEENMGLGLNDRGQAVGMLDAFPFFAFRTAPQKGVDRATDNIVPVGTPQLWPHDIDNAGRVVGEMILQAIPGPTRAFRTGPGAAFNPDTDDLGTLGGTNGSASAVNDAGVAVGTSTRADGLRRAFRVPAGRSIDPGLDDLGTLGGAESSAADINAAGWVAGSASTANGATHAFRTAPGAVIGLGDDLGVLPGMTASGAAGINARGDVVGSSYGPSDPGEAHASRAFLFMDDRMYDLNDLLDPGAAGVFLTGAIAINDRGQVLANAIFTSDGGGTRQGAVLLTAVPLPPAVYVGAAGLVGVAAAVRHAAKQSGLGRRQCRTSA